MHNLVKFTEEPTVHWLFVQDEKTNKTQKVKTTVEKRGNRVWLTYPFNRPLMAEIKLMEGAKWHGYEDPPIKQWSIIDSPRNRFQFAYLAGLDPYAWYDKPLIQHETKRPSRSHQLMMTSVMRTYHYVVIAAEMGVGKSLAAIETIDFSGFDDWWWVAPKGALNSTRLELDKWKCTRRVELYTYEALKKVLEDWPSGRKPPRGIIIDECSRAKNATSQRSQAVKYVADAIREHYGMDGYCIEMSGSPSPNNPSDWWHIAEVACPGFIKEGNTVKFTQRLAIVKQNESAGGGFYNSVLGWKDSTERCETCAKMREDVDHDVILSDANVHYHPFKACKNEVSYLYERMKGLVWVWTKKDCLDLPDKQYRLIKLKPKLETVLAAKMLADGPLGVVQKLVRLRELSDGFQYKEVKTGTIVCEACNGTKEIENLPCVTCSAEGSIPVFERTVEEVVTPKEDALIDLLDEHEDCGRLVIFAAFTASIDRVVEICRRHKWEVVRIDGRGWQYFGEQQLTDLEMLKAFQQEGGFNADRIVVVAHPGSGGMGLTLTKSPSIVYWSNDFNAESRIQSEDRIHRIGMDTNRGATIIDLIHLSTDKLVLENLNKKRELQSLSMGELQRCLEEKDD